MKRTSSLFAAVAVAAALATPSLASAQTSLTPGSWFTFEWFSGAGSTAIESFLATTTTLWVADCCNPGDVFEVFADGVSVGMTSAVASDGGGSIPDFDAAFADPTWSSGVFTVGIGQTITLVTTQVAEGYASGGAGIQSAVAVPEPGALLLLFSGLVGMGLVSRRRAFEV